VENALNLRKFLEGKDCDLIVTDDKDGDDSAIFFAGVCSTCTSSGKSCKFLEGKDCDLIVTDDEAGDDSVVRHLVFTSACGRRIIPHAVVH